MKTTDLGEIDTFGKEVQKVHKVPLSFVAFAVCDFVFVEAFAPATELLAYVLYNLTEHKHSTFTLNFSAAQAPESDWCAARVGGSLRAHWPPER